MNARLYDERGHLVGSADVDGTRLRPGTRLTVALVHDAEPIPERRALFLSGLLETVAPTIQARGTVCRIDVAVDQR